MHNQTVMLKISVIVPVYNVEKFLVRCLDSLVHQTLEEIEIICVDDGSIDNSLDILRKYARQDSRVVVVSQENLGPSAARNRGIQIATGEYIGFVDGDDWVDLDFFEKLYGSAKKYDADIACASVLRKFKSGRKRQKVLIEKEELIVSPGKKFKATGAPHFSYVWNKIYRRTALRRRKIEFKVGVFFEDIDFTIRALYYLQRLVTVPGVSYYYWVNVHSITRAMSDKMQYDSIVARRNSVKFFQKHGISYDEKWARQSRIVYKLFGIPILIIANWKTIRKYYLFGIIPFFERRMLH